MNILLDTHIVLWALADDERLTNNARVLIEDSGNKLYVSVASIWEIAIKNAKRPDKMNITAEEFCSYCDQAGVVSLPIEGKHIFELKNLPPIHNDPFDRLLISQSKSEDLYLMTHDANITQYKSNNIIEV